MSLLGYFSEEHRHLVQSMIMKFAHRGPLVYPTVRDCCSEAIQAVKSGKRPEGFPDLDPCRPANVQYAEFLLSKALSGDPK